MYINNTCLKSLKGKLGFKDGKSIAAVTEINPDHRSALLEEKNWSRFVIKDLANVGKPANEDIVADPDLVVPRHSVMRNLFK